MCHAHIDPWNGLCRTRATAGPITQDACAFFEDHVVIKDEAGHVAVDEDAVRRSRGPSRA